MRPLRTPWQAGFPDVVIQAPLASATGHADYEQAKNGDAVAALRVARAALNPVKMEQIHRTLDGRKPIIVPVHAEEAVSVNQLPMAYAHLLGDRLGLEVEDGVVQAAKMGRSGGDGFYRLANPVPFEGQIRRGAGHALIVDDTLTQGGTLAGLKGFIESQCGHVILASTLTGKQYSARLGIDPATLNTLRAHYANLEPWWHKQFGYGFDKLTEWEARYLVNCRKDADTIRDRVLESQRQGIGAHYEAGSGGRETQSIELPDTQN